MRPVLWNRQREEKKETPVRLPQSREARRVLLLTRGSIALGVAAAAWIWLGRSSGHGSAQRLPYAVRSTSDQRSLHGLPGGVMRPMSVVTVPESHPGYGAVHSGWHGPRQSRVRYIANLSDLAGPFVVSVHQFGEIDLTHTLYTNVSPNQRLPLYSMALSLRAIALRPELKERVLDFASPLTVVDDRGRRLEVLRRRRMESWFRSVEIAPPAPDARCIKYIEGDIRLRPAEKDAAGSPSWQDLRAAGNEQNAGRRPGPGELSEATEPAEHSEPGEERYHFRIENVPLPNMPHVFGLACAARIPLTTATRDTLTVLRNRNAAALARYFPPHTKDTGPLEMPNRLVLLPDAPNTFRLALNSNAYLSRTQSIDQGEILQCILTPHPGLDGEITTDVVLRRGGNAPLSVQTTLHLWENEPVVLAIPDPSSARGSHFCVQLRLFLEMPPRRFENGTASPSPFPSASKMRGGVLGGTVLVENEPLHQGTVHLELHYSDPVTQKQTVTSASAEVDNEGAWRFANLPPGTYAVQLKAVEPFVSRYALRSKSPEASLRRRYGLRRPVWKNGEPAPVTVRPGGAVLLPPFRLIEAERLPASHRLPE